MFNDVRYACRTLAASRGFTTAAVLTLALGIGANTAIFTVVYGVLLKPLPYGDPDRLVGVSETRGAGSWNVAYPNYVDWRARNHAFESMAIYNVGFGTVSLPLEGAASAVFPAGSSETNMFSVMGIRAAHGRLFGPDDAVPNNPVAVVVTDDVFQGRFGGNVGLVGRTIRVGEDTVTLGGVLPSGVRPFGVDVWFPIRALSPMQLDRSNHPGFRVVARLRPGVGVDAAQREMSAIAASLAREYPSSNSQMGVRVTPMIDAVAGTVRPTLEMLAGAVGLLLLIACANVANLLLARGLGRERETSIRSALGASRVRLVRLFVVEGLTLGTLGALAGLILAGWSVRLLHTVPGLALPRAREIAVDPHVLSFAIALGVVTTLVFALAPAIQLSRVDLMHVLRPQGSSEVTTPRQARMRALLVGVQVALLILLLTGASLMQRTLASLGAVNPGFDAASVLSVGTSVPRRYSGDAAVAVLSDRLLASSRTLHGVAATALSWPFDYSGFSWTPYINLPDHPSQPGREPSVETAAVTPGYFKAMGIPLVRGRVFNDSERPGAPVGLVVSEMFARAFFRGEDALGKRVDALHIPEMQSMTIIGIVGNTRRMGMQYGFTPEMYVAFAQFPQSGATLILRSDGRDPLLLAKDVKTAIASIDPDIAVTSTRRVADDLAATYGDRRALAWLLAVFASLALGLTTIGIGSVVSFTVAQRRTEIGIRMALGADRRGVLALVMRGAMVPVAVGGVVGLAAMYPLIGLARRYVFGISPIDPVSILTAAAVLVAASLCAAWLPARRAATIDPLQAVKAS